MKKDLAWIIDSGHRAKAQEAWDNFDSNPQEHLLNKYYNLIDEIAIEQGNISQEELSNTGMWQGNAPSFLLDCFGK